MWSTSNRFLLVALIIGGIIRAAFLVLLFADLEKDPDAYKQIAVNLRTSGVYGQVFGDRESNPRSVVQPTAFRPPLYPILLSGLVVSPDASDPPTVSRLGIATLHWLLSVIVILLTFRIGQHFRFTPVQCLVMTLMVACDPIGLRQSCLPMTETLALFCATFGVWLFTAKERNGQWESLLVGGCLGVFTLCRPTFLIWGGLLFLSQLGSLVNLFRNPKGTGANETGSKKSRALSAACLLLGMVIVLAPWTVRNWLVFGKPIFATTHGGYTIFLGNNDSFYDYLASDQDEPWDGETELQPIVQEIRVQSLKPVNEGKRAWVDEVKQDQLYYQRAMETMQRRPLDFLYASWIRVVRFWSVVPKLPELKSKENSSGVPESNARGSSELDGKSESASQQGLKSRMIQTGSLIWYSVTFLGAMIGLGRVTNWLIFDEDFRARYTSKLIPAALLILAFQGLHLIYWSNMRMRAPLVIVIALLAVFSFANRRQFSGDATK